MKGQDGAPTLFDADDEVAELRAELDIAHRENSRLRDLWYRQLHGRDRWADAVRAAAARDARNQAYGLVAAAIPETLEPLRHLARAILALPAHPAPSDLERLRALAADVDCHDPRRGDEVSAIATIQARADAEIDSWRRRAQEYWDQAQRTHRQALDSDEAYTFLVGAGWEPPSWLAKERRARIKKVHADIPADSGVHIHG
ncbi:hypothetical protein Aph01nite_43380 [Acrocarpospora phusangensis]|uniref:Uncharacterized protein n=1 Tax=Acrocarpospora phusangensis TaxID=1070424 RepID=A0A919UQ44_9ACTN|nr:hypothetical protein [Acrocarpospora phusangensis]GIH26028.1 hypothetical protein Aph01nite_43380 [Acrocarpospora phusangensis]